MDVLQNIILKTAELSWRAAIGAGLGLLAVAVFLPSHLAPVGDADGILAIAIVLIASGAGTAAVLLLVRLAPTARVLATRLRYRIAYAVLSRGEKLALAYLTNSGEDNLVFSEGDEPCERLLDRALLRLSMSSAQLRYCTLTGYGDLIVEQNRRRLRRLSRCHSSEYEQRRAECASRLIDWRIANQHSWMSR